MKVLGTSSLAPDTSILSKPADPSNDPTPSFTFGSTVAGSTFAYNLDGAGFQSLVGNTLTITNSLADGPHTIEVQATDPAGNTDLSPASYSWTINTAVTDATAPDTTIVSKPADPSNDSTPTFTFSSTESESDFEYKLDGLGWQETSDVLKLTALADGQHTILVKAIDSAGNPDPTPASYIWTVDTVAPDTTITDGPAALSNGPTPTFKFSATEGDVLFTYSVDGGVFVPGKSGLTLPALADGSHTFDVQATDAASNAGPIASYPWTIDATPPAAPGVALTNDTGSSPSDKITSKGALERERC